MKHIFPKVGEELTVDGNFFSGKNTGNSYTETDYSNKETELQNSISTGNNKFFTVQTDYVNPINDKSKIEAGLRAQFRNFQNNNTILLKDTSKSDFLEIKSAASNYKNTDEVYAAYF